MLNIISDFFNAPWYVVYNSHPFLSIISYFIAAVFGIAIALRLGDFIMRKIYKWH